MQKSYQFVLISGGADQDQKLEITVNTLQKRIGDLGLNFENEIALIYASEVDKINDRIPSVAVFFGSSSGGSNSEELLQKLVKKGIFILPVVDAGLDFSAVIPSVLHTINALFLDLEDKNCESVVGRLMEELCLLRSKRTVFVSYKRNESRAVAVQLYHSLDERTFDVFLDTHSVERGVLFQPMLWDRLGDTDLVVLLDSPNAFTSQFVELEIARAHLLGIGVLQVVWPAHARHEGTRICEVVYLEEADFDGPSQVESSTLKLEKIHEIVSLAEGLRAKSMAARRNRVIGQLYKAASEYGIGALNHAVGPSLIEHPIKGSVVVVPVVGHPSASSIHDIFEDCRSREHLRDAKGIMVYDPLGMVSKKSLHLSWLNKYLPLQTVSMDKVIDWFKNE